MRSIAMLDNVSPQPAARPLMRVAGLAKSGQRTFGALDVAEQFFDDLVRCGYTPVMRGQAGAWRVFW